MLAVALLLAASPAWTVSIDSYTDVLPWKGHVTIRSDGDVRRDDDGRTGHRVVGGAALTHVEKALSDLHGAECKPDFFPWVIPFNPRQNIVTVTVEGDAPWSFVCKWRNAAPTVLHPLLAAVAEVEHVVPIRET